MGKDRGMSICALDMEVDYENGPIMKWSASMDMDYVPGRAMIMVWSWRVHCQYAHGVEMA